jgi:hypothetical protein
MMHAPACAGIETNGMNFMKLLIVLPAILAMSTAVLAAEPTCTAPKNTWMNEATFRQGLEAQGYQIKRLKVTNGCYEIYGHDKAGKRVEISFDPATGTPAK